MAAEDRFDGIMVKVQDSGPGIPPEAQPCLFDRYNRVPGEQQKRTGFGFYISAAIIRQHRGTIGVESATGRGSTFILRCRIVNVSRQFIFYVVPGKPGKPMRSFLTSLVTDQLSL